EMSSRFAQPELSIAPSDEPFSLPDRGSSLFDKIFSKDGPGGRVYDIPYPFPGIAARASQAAGGIQPTEVLFPMGRSLQRAAAIVGMTNVTSTDPFFRYPRLVLGFTDDSQDTGGNLNLNLHGRFYVGFNERAQILEVISYNDEAGRFEYEVVRNY